MHYYLKNKDANVFYILEDAMNAELTKGTSEPAGEVIGTIDLDTAGVQMEKNKLYLLVPRHPVTSSQIASVGYHYAASMMVIEFTNGSVYEYEDVPYDIYETLIESKSLGTYFHKRIRDQFNTIKVEDKK